MTPAAAAAARTAAQAGVSGTVAMGGGATGTVREQTGAFTTAFPLVSLPGRGSTGVELALAYDQTAAAAGTDRHGLGQGTGLGKPFIDPDGGGTLHTASGGGSYPLRPGDTEGTGLQRYLLKDLALREQRGTLPAREGLDGVPREYRWVLAYDDGRKNFFAAEGDLVAEQDVYGHETAYAWNTENGQHRLEKAVDSWGQAVTFDYSCEDRVTVTSPVRSDGQRPEVVLHLDAGRLTSITYPEDQTIRLAWDHTPEGMPGRLLTRVEAPTGAVTRIGYDAPHGFPIASSLKVTDQQGKNLTPERTFRLTAEGEHAGHDFTGRGQYESADALFDSADEDYRYATELSDGSSTVRSVYNSLHLLKERTATLTVNGEQKPVRTQQLQYEGEQEDGQAPPPASDLPANYGKPVRATVTVHDPATGRSRTTTETARFDEHGRETERTDVTGATTVTEYGPTALDPVQVSRDGGGEEKPLAGYGLPLRITVTGADGTQTVTENTLTADRKSIAAARQLVKNTGEQEPSARTVTTFQTDGHGELTGRTVTWAEGAKPEGVTGPDEVSETYETAVDTGAHTRTATVTTAAGSSSTVTDLVTGQAVRTTDASGRTGVTGYDLAGRPVTQEMPGGPEGKGLVTTTSYSPLTTTVSAPGRDGKQHITTEHRDLLGRTVKQTDNVSGGELTDDPAARTLQSVTFTGEGRTAEVTDQAGRTTVTTSDALGRPVKTVAPNGMTELRVYADAATADTSTVTTLTLPAGETDPARAVSTRTETSDQAGRPVASAASFADGTRQSGSSQAYDGLGRTAEAVSGDVALTPAYGPAGTPAVTTLTPTDTGSFPGGKITVEARNDLTGAPVAKTLTPGQGGEGRSGMTLIRDAAGRVTEERRPDGTKTVFAYTPGGQVAQTVSPSGIRTAYEYDGATGQVLQVTATAPDGKTSEKTAYTYDPHTGDVTSVFSPDDTAGSRITYRYDADGHVTETAYPDGKTVRQAYGDDGLLEKTTDTAGLATYYTYNPDGTLAEAVQHERDDTESPVTASVAYTYDGLGRIIRADLGNGAATEVEFTSAHQIQREKTTRDGKLITEASYLYDAHSNLTQRTDTRPGPADADGTAGVTTTRYTYDAYDRLLSSQVRDASGQELTATRYTLSVSGDVVRTETASRTGGQAAQTAVTEHGIDATGRLTTVTTGGQEHAQTFDAEGNLLTDYRGNTYTYSLRGQPLTLTAPGAPAVRYTYWADGTRATAVQQAPATQENAGTGPEQVTGFYYSPDKTLLNDTYTSGDTGTATASYLMAGTRHARTLTGSGADQAAATGAGYLIHDRHGNTTALISPAGQTVQAWNYTDYGQPAAPAGTPLAPGPAEPAGAGRNPFTYAGQYTGPDGTQYLQARVYDPAQARFITPDPAPQFNRYQYANANPVGFTDPAGTTAVPDAVSWLNIALAAFSVAAAVFATVATYGIAPGLAMTGLATGLASAALDLTAAVNDASGFIGNDSISSALQWTALGLGAVGTLAGIPNTALGAAATAYSRLGKAVNITKSAVTRASGETRDNELAGIMRNVRAALGGSDNTCATAAIAFHRCSPGDEIELDRAAKVFDYISFQEQAEIPGKWTGILTRQAALQYMESREVGTKFIVMGEMNNHPIAKLGNMLFPGTFGHYANAEKVIDETGEITVMIYDAFAGVRRRASEYTQAKIFSGNWRVLITGDSAS
ncbi:RHS repeat-associated core domain-containing protein [Streptomyces sp. NPDC096030]|uniref:RHS repeat domain-containing protein n=1 Tax=Streptomyces sp. NPDC096030 TaxID=3155423 RepID=UPI0033220ED1